MEAINELFETHFFALADARLEYQRLKLKEMWLPKLTKELLVMVEECTTRLLSVFPEYAELPDSSDQQIEFKMHLAEHFIDIGKAQIRSAQNLLREMVKAEAVELWEIITVNGLMDNNAQLEADEIIFKYGDLDDLACSGPIYQSVMKSVLEFIEKSYITLNTSRLNGNKTLSKDELDLILSWWQNRLATIARTILHESFTRTMDAVIKLTM